MTTPLAQVQAIIARRNAAGATALSLNLGLLNLNLTLNADVASLLNNAASDIDTLLGIVSQLTNGTNDPTTVNVMQVGKIVKTRSQAIEHG